MRIEDLLGKWTSSPRGHLIEIIVEKDSVYYNGGPKSALQVKPDGSVNWSAYGTRYVLYDYEDGITWWIEGNISLGEEKPQKWYVWRRDNCAAPWMDSLEPNLVHAIARCIYVEFC